MKYTTATARLAAGLLAATLVAGCASSRNKELLQSFEDISAGYTRNGFKVNQIRTMSINGQLPFTDIGSLYYYKPQRGNLAAIGLSLSGTNENTPFTNSHELIQNFTNGMKVGELVELRTKVIDVATKASLLVAAQQSLVEATTALEKAQKEAALPKSPPATTGTTNVTTTTTSSTTTATTNATNGTSNATTTATNTTTKLTPPAAAPAAEPAAGSVASKLKLAHDAHTNAQFELRAARTNLQNASSNAMKALSSQNTFVFRWQTDTKKDFNILAGNTASASLRKELGRSGFVIVAGMRSRTLVLSEQDGNRLESRVNTTFPVGKDSILTDWWPSVYSPGMYVVSHVLEAQKIAYVSEQSLMQAIKLHAEYSKGQKLKDIDRVVLDLAMSSLASLANAGVVASTGNERRPVVIGGIPNPRGGTESKCCETHWTPIMGVTTRLQNLDELFNRNTPFWDDWFKYPPSSRSTTN